MLFLLTGGCHGPTVRLNAGSYLNRLRLSLESTCNCHYKHLRCSCTEQCASTFRDRRTGSKDVIHQQDIPACEIRTRGAPQIRQPEGKRVAKRLSAMPRSEAFRLNARRFLSGKSPAPVARIGSPLLLKTNLPVSLDEVPGQTPFQYKGSHIEHATREGLSSRPMGYASSVALTRLNKYPLIGSAKAIGTANRAHAQCRQKVLFCEGSWA
jgi:hypothetical protein